MGGSRWVADARECPLVRKCTCLVPPKRLNFVRTANTGADLQGFFEAL